MRKTQVVITCEHGGNEVPATYAPRFAGHEALLASHRGWDPGALDLGRALAHELAVPIRYATTTRLLVDLNRSIGHRQLFSEITRALPRSEQQAIIDRYYRPYRDAVESEIASAIAAGRRVIHIASHSFTPVLHGVQRRADVAWLYDPRRSHEQAFAQRWRHVLASRAPALQLRRNYPYQGRSDGLTALLRKRHPDAAYAGIELEVNQRFVTAGGPAWTTLQADVVASLRTMLAAS